MLYTFIQFRSGLIQNDVSLLQTVSFPLQFVLNQPAYFLSGEGLILNTGYLLAGLIMDKVLRAHLFTAMRDRIFTPF